MSFKHAVGRSFVSILQAIQAFPGWMGLCDLTRGNSKWRKTAASFWERSASVPWPLLSAGKHSLKDHQQEGNSASRPGQVWHLPHLGGLSPKEKSSDSGSLRSFISYVVGDLSTNSCRLVHGVDLMNNVFGVLFKSFVNEVRVMAHIEQMFHIFHILLVLVFERNDQAKTIMEFAGQFILFNYDPSPAMACFSLRMMTQKYVAKPSER